MLGCQKDAVKLRPTKGSREWSKDAIFDNNKISSFEAIVKHLRENVKLKNKDIASKLNRTQSGVASTYLKAKKKMPENLILFLAA